VPTISSCCHFGTPDDFARLDLTNFGAFHGAFNFVFPKTGSFSTASADA
jgi:hypothetical protein